MLIDSFIRSSSADYDIIHQLFDKDQLMAIPPPPDFDQQRENSTTNRTNRQSEMFAWRSRSKRNRKRFPEMDSGIPLVLPRSIADSTTALNDGEFLLFQSATPPQRRIIPIYQVTHSEGNSPDRGHVYFKLPHSTSRKHGKDSKLQIFAIEYDTAPEFDRMFESTDFNKGKDIADVR